MSKLHNTINITPNLPTNIGGTAPIDPADISAEDQSMDLEPEDYMFIDYILNDLSIEGHLPFLLPIESMPRIIVDAALWFYRNCNEATEERYYAIRHTDLCTNGKFNKEVLLPYQIEAISQVFPVSGGTIGVLTQFSREPMYYAANTYQTGNSTYSTRYGSVYSQMLGEQMLENGVAKMFEYSSLKTLFRQGIRFDFNPNTHILNIMSNTGKDLVLAVFQRIGLKYLYNDINFRKYCVGCAMEQLQRLLSTFNYKYPGEVTINFDEMSKRGTELKAKIEEIVLKESSSPDFFIVK